MVLAIFVDGLGLGAADLAANPAMDGSLLVLPGILSGSRPLDATLGVPGLPQSATGQASLFAGVNAARELGRHFQGFPSPALRRLLIRGTFYSRLLAAGGSVAFLNAFGSRSIRRLVSGPPRVSCSTLAAISAGVPLRDARDVRLGRGLYHDISGERLRAQGDDVPLLSPEEGAQVALRVAGDHDLTLFEYFLTDHAGHSGDREAALNALRPLDRFMGSILEEMRRPVPLDAGDALYLVMFSDHGNVEDMTCSTHTANPVPLFVAPSGGRGVPPGKPGSCGSLTSVAGLLVALALETGRAGPDGGRMPGGPADAPERVPRGSTGGP